MTYYVVVFDRARRRLLREEPFASRDAALSARFAAEREAAGTDREIVVLGARDERDLRRTHRRYFETLSELTATASSTSTS